MRVRSHGGQRNVYIKDSMCVCVCLSCIHVSGGPENGVCECVCVIQLKSTEGDDVVTGQRF